MAQERLLDVFSRINENGHPHYHTCTLIVGDGTQKVSFANGRAQVPESIARILVENPKLDIPALGTGEDRFYPGQTMTAAQGEETEALRARVAELEAALANQAASDTPRDLEIADSDTPPAPVATDGEESEESEESEEVRLAKQMLAEEGEQVPDVEVTVPDGFAAATADGQPRCLAAKGDGSQCANAAVDAGACTIEKHKQQVAERP